MVRIWNPELFLILNQDPCSSPFDSREPAMRLMPEWSPATAVEGLPSLAAANHGHAKLLATAGSSSRATADGATHRHLLWRRKWHNGGLGEHRGERGRAEEVRACE